MNCFSGKLSCHFYEMESGKVYEWKRAIITFYEEIVHSFTGEPMKTRVIFSPFDLRVNNLFISRYSGKAEKGTWYFDEPEQEKTIVSEMKEPKILNLYYTDLEGNRIQKGKIGQEIYLVIKGQNLKGEETDLDLSDNETDFEYKGERLANDILKGYVFEKEEEQIPLKVIEPKD